MSPGLFGLICVLGLLVAGKLIVGLQTGQFASQFGVVERRKHPRTFHATAMANCLVLLYLAYFVLHQIGAFGF
jgi:hypothetical protein